MEAVINNTARRDDPRFLDSESIRRRAERIRMNWSADERKQRAEQARRYLVQLAGQA